MIADDHPLFRDGVARTLEESGALQVVAATGTAEAAIRAVEEHLPDIVCLDISLPGNGLDAARVIGERFPAVRIVMLTVSESDDDVMTAFKAGAKGYVLKGIGAAELVEVLTGVAAGGSYVSPSLAARVLGAMKSPRADGAAADPLDSLTRREEQILDLVAKGLSNKEIGRELALQEKTVKHYMTNILQKLHVRNRVEAALLAAGRSR
ncbi:response regulator [Paralimibaculum aggregatum]|uniref:response regulator n=1 Tax=Paralimibaculum aggregatum TaxID=3036245 RepID=UPI002554926D|nr:response regulator transcription factor [Limibaculum sp. NKW23]